MSSDKQEVIRDGQGRFIVPPKSPGRPARGQGESEAIRQQLSVRRQDLVEKALEYALAGDAAWGRVVFSYLGAPQKPESEKVSVPGLKDAETLEEKATAILGAVADGEISAEAGDRLLRMLKTYQDAVAIDELHARLDKLEGKGRPAIPTTITLEPEDDDEYT
jgi:hypothetical protein